VPFKPATPADRDEVARMRWPSHQYGNGLTVSEKQNAILSEINGEPREISASGERLGQPSVSHDHKLIVYVRHAYN
jgi:hypothetical protein